MPMLLVPAVVAAIVALLGFRIAQKKSGWWRSIHQPSLTPSLSALGGIWLATHLLFGFGVGMALRESSRSLVPVLAGISVVAGWLWVATLFGRMSVRNGFFMVSVAWAPATLTAMAAMVQDPAAGAFTAALALLLSVAAVWSFVLWQINEPTRYG